MEISYGELRCKEVVNLTSGTKMGRVIDMIIDRNGKDVLGVVVPGVRKLFRANEDIFVPWNQIEKIGSDVILISLDLHAVANVTRAKGKKSSELECCEEDFIQ